MEQIDLDLYKAQTRRWLFLGFGAIATITLAGIAGLGALYEAPELITLAGGGLLTNLGVVIGYYASKKASEE